MTDEMSERIDAATKIMDEIFGRGAKMHSAIEHLRMGALTHGIGAVRILADGEIEMIAPGSFRPIEENEDGSADTMREILDLIDKCGEGKKHD